MPSKRAGAAMTILVLHTACGGGETAAPPVPPTFTGPTSTGPLLGATPFLVDAAIFEYFYSEEIDTAFAEHGAFPFEALPDQGVARYNGVIAGRTAPGAEAQMLYFADLELILSFFDNSVLGVTRSFTTSLHRFEQPSGGVPIFGRIVNDDGTTGVNFSGSLVLEGEPDVGSFFFPGPPTMNVTLSGTGNIGGPGGSLGKGTVSATFKDTVGPYQALTFETDGTWHAN